MTSQPALGPGRRGAGEAGALDRKLRTPPELEGVDWHDDAPRRPRPIVTLVAWIAILGLVLSVGAGIFSAF